MLPAMIQCCNKKQINNNILICSSQTFSTLLGLLGNDFDGGVA